MNLRYSLILLLFTIYFSALAQKELVQIYPINPEIGQKVTISYLPKNKKLTLKPNLVISYSNFFEMPNVIPLVINGERWETSFIVPRYAKYASFYIKQGDSIYRLDPKNHYELIFHKDGKPVFDTYLYKSYSLQAQIGKSDSLKIFANNLIEKELALYPNNYAAKLVRLSNAMSYDKKNAKTYVKEGLAIIDKKLNENPTSMANINQVTMGYIIIGENPRMDTLKQLILQNYPTSEVGYEYLYEIAYKTKDESEQFNKLTQLLSQIPPGESSLHVGINKKLFMYHVKLKNENIALIHARGVASVKNPWLPKELKELATILSANNMALDSAKMYAEMALKTVNDYPFGVIRSFPEYGYIPGYVANRDSLISEQKGEILSIIGSIYTRQEKYTLAEEMLKEAMKFSKNIAVYQNLAYLYEQTKQPKLAFEVYKIILLQMPVDSLMLSNFKRNYITYHGSNNGYETQLSLIQKEWEELNLPKLQAGKLNLPAPIFNNVYDMKGNLINPTILQGKTIIIDFWATWCVPCIEGFPYMQKVFNQFKNNKDVVFMIMNSGSKNSLLDAQNWVKLNNFTFPIYYNDRKLAEAFQVTTIPSTFLIDKYGKIRYKTVGFEGPIMEAKLALEIKDLITN